MVSLSVLGRYTAGVVAVSAVTIAAAAMHHKTKHADGLRRAVALSPTRTIAESLTVDGVTRTYWLHIPTHHATPTALVVAFDDTARSGASVEAATGFSQVADRAGFIVAYPDAMRSAAVRITSDSTSAMDPDAEASLVHELVDDLGARFDVDVMRVYAAGFANGATLARELACEGDDQFAAIGAVDSTTPPGPPTSVSLDASLNALRTAPLGIADSLCDDSVPLVTIDSHTRHAADSLWSFFIGHVSP